MSERSFASGSTATSHRPVTLHEEPCAVGELLRRRAGQFPDRPFCYVAGEGYTFAELDQRSDDVAAGLAAHGVKHGDRVALLMLNRIEFVEAYFALAKLGAILVPLNAFLKGDFLRHQLADSRATVLIADGSGCAAVAPLLPELPDLRLIAPVDADHSGPDNSGMSVVPFASLAGTGAAAPRVEVAIEDIMSILYTSGTTGYPKGCVLTHAFYARVGRMAIQSLGLTSGDSIITALPMFHLSGSVWTLASALIQGIPAYFEAQFSARAFLPNAAAARATVALGVGAMCHALMATPPSPADREHSLRLMMVAPLSTADQEKFRQRFGIEPWTEVYGQTECMPLTFNPVESQRDRAGCGFAAPDLEVALLGDDLVPVAEDEVGEICIRPKAQGAMFSGYWGNPEATLRAFRGLWYHTGDSARRLPSGQFAFVDRKDDVLRRKGENVSSLELEAAIRSVPKVAEVAVIAVPSESTEDDIKACIVLEAGSGLAPEELFEQLREKLPYFAMPQYVEILEALPLNAMNRVQKHLLKKRPNGDQVWDFAKMGLTIARDGRR